LTFWRKIFGARGERAAARFLRRAGCRILARNYSTPLGEIDLIALDKRDGRIIFAEVKTRTDESVATAEQAVGREKQRHIIRAAQIFLKRKRVGQDVPLRFDVLAVTFDAAGKAQVRHTPGAFRV
jgi:putative endonuclease